MKAAYNISLTFDQILNLVKQLPKTEKLRLSQELEKEAIESKLTALLEGFAKENITQEEIDREVEAVRQERYDQQQKP
ncbi:hypothetical protein BH09BAC1_BH09BAC1_23930 [soil metagenome]